MCYSQLLDAPPMIALFESVLVASVPEPLKLVLKDPPVDPVEVVSVTYREIGGVNGLESAKIGEIGF